MPGPEHQTAQELIEAEGMGVARDVFCLHCGLHDGQAGTARIIGRVATGNTVELRRRLVESDGVFLRQDAPANPERLGHEKTGHGVARAGSQIALIERLAVALVADRLDCRGAGREGTVARTMLDVAAEPPGTVSLFDDYRLAL
jgi:hypothetical protein